MTATKDGVPPVNSPQWWEDYFRHHWDANGGAEQTRHFMRRLIDELPAPEREHLRERARSILDWGCAHGEGVDELARAFGANKVWGLDAAPSAVAGASRRFPQHTFVHAPDGAIPRRADVVVSSNCLEHFADPWPVAERLARAAEDLLVLLVPYAEDPLCASHVVRFDDDSFPDQLAGLRRLLRKRIAMDPRIWAGEQLLVVYAAPSYLARRPAGDALAEREKWERHYATVALEAESEVMARFGAEFAAMVASLLPAGGRVLEAGAGAGWHALALARTGKFEVTLLDFSAQALRHARALFAREGQQARFVLGDAREHGVAEYDLVFNSGVLEHFSFAEQVGFLRAMASRSRGLVLALVPNRLCYWYWVWRVQAGARAEWPFGREAPPLELSSAFAAAGLDVVGERVLGTDWTESFFSYLEDAGPRLLDCLRVVHRSPLVPDEARGYLRAALGRVAGSPSGPAPGWLPAGPPSPPAEAALTAAVADALALQLGVPGDLARSERERARATALAAEQTALATALRAQLAEAVAAGERRAQELAREQGALHEQLAALQRELAQQTQAREELDAALREATAAGAKLAQERAALDDGVRAARAELALRAAERDQLAAANRELTDWRQMVEGSRTFRWLRALDRFRARLRRG